MWTFPSQPFIRISRISTISAGVKFWWNAARCRGHPRDLAPPYVSLARMYQDLGGVVAQVRDLRGVAGREDHRHVSVRSGGRCQALGQVGGSGCGEQSRLGGAPNILGWWNELGMLRHTVALGIFDAHSVDLGCSEGEDVALAAHQGGKRVRDCSIVIRRMRDNAEPLIRQGCLWHFLFEDGVAHEG